MFPVDFNKGQCPLSFFCDAPGDLRNSPMSPVDFNKGQCRSVGFKGQGPLRSQTILNTHPTHVGSDSMLLLLLIKPGYAAQRPLGYFL